MPSCTGSNSNQIQVSTAASVKIVNGDDADIKDHPWMVSFQLGKSGVNFTHKCGGAIIDKSWHNKFEPGTTGLQNDLMLLQLRKPLKFGSSIKQIDLDINKGHNYTGQVCTITGWGKTDAKGKNSPDRLQVQYMPVVTNAYCNSTWFLFQKYSLFPEAYSKNFICLQDNIKDSCEGDSGGPMVCSNKLVGALSLGANPAMEVYQVCIPKFLLTWTGLKTK
ncbi:PRSS1_2_3 [Mytilus edulis]|uniref:PRSS1_2_3 n=1 Tax=Mytilus edulis TaxID=6550 RepID=A0A8S3ULW0_MYTED|nr:PRSS1_2_3 [Mytilus edulis]